MGDISYGSTTFLSASYFIWIFLRGVCWLSGDGFGRGFEGDSNFYYPHEVDSRASLFIGGNRTWQNSRWIFSVFLSLVKGNRVERIWFFMNNKTDVRDFIDEKNTVRRDKRYNEYVKENTPKKSWLINMLKAWLVGGIICVIGQCFLNWYASLGMGKETSALYTTVSLILLSVVLTGLNLYSKIANFAGAGTLVPITGFANSVAAPAIEFKKEGWVFGVGCKIFTIAGPVILYGVVTSWLLGFIYWLGKMLGWV